MPKTPFSFDNETTTSKKNSKGFYAVLALCLLAVGGVAAAAFSDQRPLPTAQETAPSTTSAFTSSSAAPAAATRITSAPTSSSSAPTTAATTAPPSLFSLPMGNAVLTPFSTQPRYNQILDSYEVHAAVDFDGEEGQGVYAFAKGNISRIENDPLWGESITIDHGDGILSIYRGVQCRLSMGSAVETGQEIGKLAAVPCELELGPHLHIELYQSGTPVDICTLLDTEMVTRTTSKP